MKRKDFYKYITISAACGVFLVGCALGVQSSETPNETNVQVETHYASLNTYLEVETKSVEAIEIKETTTIEQTTAILTQKETTAAQTIPVIEETTTAVIVEEPTTVAETTSPVVQEETKPTIDGIVEQVIILTNQIRSTAGVAEVTYDATLTEMAQVRASENAANNWFKVENGKHIRPDGRVASSIALDYQQYGKFGENMGRYQSTPQEIVEGWKNSQSHYNCMTNSNYKRIGIGYATDNNGYIYWNMILMD